MSDFFAYEHGHLAKTALDLMGQRDSLKAERDRLRERVEKLRNAIRALEINRNGNHDWKGNPRTATYAVARSRLVELFGALQSDEREG